MSVNTYITCDGCRMPVENEAKIYCQPCLTGKIAEIVALKNSIEDLEGELKDTLSDYNAAQEKVNRIIGQVAKDTAERIEERRIDREVIDGLRGQVEAYEQTIREAGSR